MVLLVLGSERVAVGQYAAGHHIAVRDEPSTPRLPGEQSHGAGRHEPLAFCCGVWIGILPRRQVRPAIADDELTGKREIEQKRLVQRRALDDDAAEMSRPRDTDRVAFSTLYPRVADGAGLDAGRIERLSADEPASGLGQAQPERLCSGAVGEEPVVAGQVEDEGRRVLDLVLSSTEVRDLEEGPLRVEQIESRLKVSQIRRDQVERDAVSPPLCPLTGVPTLTFVVVGGAIEDREKQPEDGKGLRRQLADDVRISPASSNAVWIDTSAVRPST